MDYVSRKTCVSGGTPEHERLLWAGALICIDDGGFPNQACLGRHASAGSRRDGVKKRMLNA